MSAACRENRKDCCRGRLETTEQRDIQRAGQCGDREPRSRDRTACRESVPASSISSVASGPKLTSPPKAIVPGLKPGRMSPSMKHVPGAGDTVAGEAAQKHGRALQAAGRTHLDRAVVDDVVEEIGLSAAGDDDPARRCEIVLSVVTSPNTSETPAVNVSAPLFCRPP